MIRFLFRLLALVSLAAGVILAVLDATRSVAAAGLVLTPLRQTWEQASPQTLGAVQGWIEASLHPGLWAVIDGVLLGLPGPVVFALLALLLHAVGRRPERRPGAFLADH